MPSDKAISGPIGFLSSCLSCFPYRMANLPPQKNRAARYNNQLPARVADDLNGFTTVPLDGDPSPPPSERTRISLPDSLQYSLPSRAQAPTPSRMRAASRFPTAVSFGNNTGDPRERWTSTTLSNAQLVELLSAVHATLEHVPYAICGLGALVSHGHTTRQVNKVTILCPQYAKDNVRAWLAARGYEAFADSIGIPLGPARQVRRVRIKYLADGFEKMERVRAPASAAWILGLASQLDHAAAGFVDHCRKLQRLRSGGGARDKELDHSERALKTIAGDVFWCLDKAARTRYTLRPWLMPTLLGEEFWVPFTARNENARTEMARAGIDVAAVLADHRAKEAMREHEALLKGYGVGIDDEESGEGVVKDQPGPFEGMRTLANSKSLWTLKDRESMMQIGADGSPMGASFPETPTSTASVPPTPLSALPELPPTPKETKPQNKFLTGLLPKRSNSAREGRSQDDKAKEYGRSLTRSNSARPPPRDPKDNPFARYSEDITRPTGEWI
ncbi:hypothetical protein F4819DRAFT_503582 [Hypoxylon fuscum]|nr:hypothetical protein F4819DRAFT_503582 [Hypoxylon fuscum]